MPVRIFGPERSTSTESGRFRRSAAARARRIASACSSCVPCDMLMRTAFAPAASSDSTTAASREAGPSVASILALLNSGDPSVDFSGMTSAVVILRPRIVNAEREKGESRRQSRSSRALTAFCFPPTAFFFSVGLRREGGRDGLFEVCGGVPVVADEVLDYPALSVNDEGVRDAVVVCEEETDGVLVGVAELVLYLVALDEVGDFGPVFLAADVEADDLQALRAEALL